MSKWQKKCHFDTFSAILTVFLIGRFLFLDSIEYDEQGNPLNGCGKDGEKRE